MKSEDLVDEGGRVHQGEREVSQFTDNELLYAATVRCHCGAGLAHPLNVEESLRLRAWICSASLKGEADDSRHDEYDFAFYKIREETSINNSGGQTTRPFGTVALTVGHAKCPRCEAEWQSEPYSACGANHHWFSGPCPGCEYAVAAEGSWSSRDGEPISHGYSTIIQEVPA